jgi:two-component system, chemotaxis family, protein-glutamate methylesterase/glutaminase
MKQQDPFAGTRDVVVIGASAGGVAALRTIVSQLPLDFQATVLVVLHIGAHRSQLANVLRRAGVLPVDVAIDGAVPRPGHVHVAPSDHHLLLHDGRLRLTRGPREHHTRPAIDPLFRSAALSAGPRVIGVLLSGCNEDGTPGLQAIKSCGGLAIVQDPADADEPAMPASALRSLAVDHTLPASDIAPALARLAGQAVPQAAPTEPPTSLVHEMAMCLPDGEPFEHLKAIGTPSGFSCPDCSGGLFEIEGTRPLRLRCHTGHAYTAQTLKDRYDETTEEALRSAVRALQEKEALMRKLAQLDRIAGDEARARDSDATAQRLAAQVMALRRLTEEAA